MEITVLGCGAAFPRAGGACSGFLVSSGDTHVWIDAGNGTFSNLQKHISYRDVDAMIITHGHADHVADVLPMMYALGFDPEHEPVTIPVFAPGDVEPTLKWPLGGKSKEIFKAVFDFRAMVGPFNLRDIRFEPFPTKHPADTFGLRISDDDTVAVYTSDTAMFSELTDACRDADVLIAEATYIDGIEADPDVHMWAREAGRLAAQSGAKRLVLTHIWATFDPAVAVAQASEEFSGTVEAAIEGARYTL